MKKLMLLGLMALIYVGCAHHKNVRPGADGIHRITLRTDNTGSASNNAMKQAHYFCEKRNQYAVVLEETDKYTGSMDESTYRKAKMASQVAKGVGGAAVVFGGKNEKKAGTIVAVGGGIADAAIGNGYTYEMKFKCQ